MSEITVDGAYQKLNEALDEQKIGFENLREEIGL